MALADFIRKEQGLYIQDDALYEKMKGMLSQSIAKAQREAAKYAYEKICKHIAKKVASGERIISGICELPCSLRVWEGMEEFAACGPEEMRSAVCKEMNVSYSYSSDMEKLWSVSVMHSLSLGTIKGRYTAENEDIPYSKKLVPLPAWEDFVSGLKSLLAKDNITVNFLSGAKMWKKEYLQKNEEEWFAFAEIGQELNIGEGRAKKIRRNHSIDTLTGIFHLQPVADYTYTYPGY